MNQERVVAYITAYEDLAAVQACILAIKKQSRSVESIFVLDNSKYALSLSYEGVYVEHYPENIGVGGGVCRGIAWAIAQGADFLWMFDQDSVPLPDCLSQLLEAFRTEPKLAIVAPTAIDPRTGEYILGARFAGDRFEACLAQQVPYECDAPITSGSLLCLKAARTVDPPRADLFIDGVDLDYGLRLRHQGYRHLILPQARLHHHFGNPIPGQWFDRGAYVQSYSALRHYYICRNHTYLATRYARGGQRVTALLRRGKYMLHAMLSIWVGVRGSVPEADRGSVPEADRDRRLLKLWACLLGTFHGIRGKLGKLWLSGK